VTELWFISYLSKIINVKRVYPKVGGIRPTPRYYHASAALNGGSEILIFGGVRPKEFL